MRIKRTFEKSLLLVVVSSFANHGRVKRPFAPNAASRCFRTGKPPGVFGIEQHRVFQIIKANATHFAEIGAGAALICISSLGRALESEGNLTPADGDGKKR